MNDSRGNRRRELINWAKTLLLFLSAAASIGTEIQLDAAFHWNFILFNSRCKDSVVWNQVRHTHTHTTGSSLYFC